MLFCINCNKFHENETIETINKYISEINEYIIKLKQRNLKIKRKHDINSKVHEKIYTDLYLSFLKDCGNIKQNTNRKQITSFGIRSIDDYINIDESMMLAIKCICNKLIDEKIDDLIYNLKRNFSNIDQINNDYY